jgi:hypothetical protein
LNEGRLRGGFVRLDSLLAEIVPGGKVKKKPPASSAKSWPQSTPVIA